MPVWVQLRRKKRLDVAGSPRTFYPGDWVQVGRQTGRRFILDGDAIAPDEQIKSLNSTDVGVLVTGGPSDAGRDVGAKLGVPIEFNTPSCRWARTCCYDARLTLVRPGLIPVGFELLERWQVAVPLWDYKVLAQDVGTEDERERTLQVIRDLRVPLYDTRLVFLRECTESRALVAQWMEERMDSTEDRLAFLRALYQVKPLVLALPCTWTLGPQYQ